MSTGPLSEISKVPVGDPQRSCGSGFPAAGCHAVSLSHNYRITLTLLLTETEIILLDVGSHDEVYR